MTEAIFNCPDENATKSEIMQQFREHITEKDLSFVEIVITFDGEKSQAQIHSNTKGTDLLLAGLQLDKLKEDLQTQVAKRILSDIFNDDKEASE